MTFVRCGGMLINFYGKCTAESFVEKQIENRLAFRKVTSKSIAVPFFGTRCSIRKIKMRPLGRHTGSSRWPLSRWSLRSWNNRNRSQGWIQEGSLGSDELSSIQVWCLKNLELVVFTEIVATRTYWIVVCARPGLLCRGKEANYLPFEPGGQIFTFQV